MLTTEATVVIPVVLIILMAFMAVFGYFMALDLFSLQTKREMLLSVFEGSTMMNSSEDVDSGPESRVGLTRTEYRWEPEAQTRIALLPDRIFTFRSVLAYDRSNRYFFAWLYDEADSLKDQIEANDENNLQ
jgi:hypothetical protein